MIDDNLNRDLSEGMAKSLAKARLKFLQKKAKEDGVVIIADRKGKISRIPAKQLLKETEK